MRYLALCGLVVFTGCGPKPQDNKTEEVRTVTVTVEPVQLREIQRSVAVVGTLNGYEEVTLSPKVDGRVLAIRADVGDVVAPGALLLELDPTDYQLAIVEAQQALNAELAKLGLSELPEGEFDVENTPSVKRMSVALEDAERKLKQKRDLYERQAVSKDELDVAETEMRLAQATKVQSVTEARAVLAAARLRKASLQVAEQRLRDCRLTVPSPVGTTSAPTQMRYAVAERMLTEGSMVRSMPAINAFRLVLAHALKLRSMVPERYAPDIKVGQTVEVLADAVPGNSFTGKIVRVNPTIEPLNRTFQVEIEVPNADGQLKCGGFARATIQTGLATNRPTVPNAAIVSFAGVEKIFLVEGDHVKAVEVQIGTRSKDWVEIRNELPAESVVVTSGQTQLVDGTAISVRQPVNPSK